MLILLCAAVLVLQLTFIFHQFLQEESTESPRSSDEDIIGEVEGFSATSCASQSIQIIRMYRSRIIDLLREMG